MDFMYVWHLRPRPYNLHESTEGNVYMYLPKCSDVLKYNYKLVFAH